MSLSRALYKYEIEYCIKNPISAMKFCEVFADVKSSSQSPQKKESNQFMLPSFPPLIEEKEDESSSPDELHAGPIVINQRLRIFNKRTIPIIYKYIYIILNIEARYIYIYV